MVRRLIQSMSAKPGITDPAWWNVQYMVYNIHPVATQKWFWLILTAFTARKPQNNWGAPGILDLHIIMKFGQWLSSIQPPNPRHHRVLLKCSAPFVSDPNSCQAQHRESTKLNPKCLAPSLLSYNLVRVGWLEATTTKNKHVNDTARHHDVESSMTM